MWYHTLVFKPFDARSAAEAIATELQAGDENFALRMLITAINDLRRAIASGDDDQVAAFLVEPATTGSERWDALLGAQVGRELRRSGRPLPGWAIPKPLKRMWFVTLFSPLLIARTIQRTSPDLACLGIWLDDSSFDVA
jgi:hypothetical protein